MSLKSGSDIRLKKETPFLQVDFNTPGAPTINTGIGWSLLSSSAGANQEDAVCLWEDTIDLTGVQMADLSMVNQGSGVVRRGLYTQASLLENLNIIDVHVISLVPLDFSTVDWLFSAIGNDADNPLTDDRVLMFNIASYKRGQQDASYVFSQNDGAVYGSASSFSNTRLHVYRLVAFYRLSYVSAPPGGAPAQVALAGTGNMTVPRTSFAQLCKLEEFNSVATAYAIYRGNDVQQTYDNP